MTNINLIEELISSINSYLKIVKDNYGRRSQKEIENDLFLKISLERYLYLVIQEAISLAEAVISFKDFRRPDSYANSFEILNEQKIISQNLAERLIKMVGFRNIVAHNYKKLDFNIVYNVLQSRLQDIEKFIIEIKKVI